MTKRIFIDPNNIDYSFIREAVELILKGKIVALPTETVYGLGVAYNDRAAIQRLYKIKRRPKDKPFTLCLADIEKTTDLFSILPPFGYRILEKFWPGPLTVIAYARGSEDKIGIRVSSHSVLNAILKELNTPIYLPSANISGEKDAVSAQEVENVFDQAIDLIIDAGPVQFSKPSTVVDLTYHPFKMLREGVISLKDLMLVFFKKRILFVCTGNTCRSPMAEYILKKIIEQRFPYILERYEIISRGIISLEDTPANFETLKILEEKEDIDASSHRSKKIDRKTVLSSDLIFVMEETHKDYITSLEPTAENRIFPLKKFLSTDSQEDIVDPIGKSYEVYEEVHCLIKDAILELIDWLS